MGGRCAYPEIDSVRRPTGYYKVVTLQYVRSRTGHSEIGKAHAVESHHFESEAGLLEQSLRHSHSPAVQAEYCCLAKAECLSRRQEVRGSWLAEPNSRGLEIVVLHRSPVHFSTSCVSSPEARRGKDAQYFF